MCFCFVSQHRQTTKLHQHSHPILIVYSIVHKLKKIHNIAQNLTITYTSFDGQAKQASQAGSGLLHTDLAQLQAQSTGEDSNSSDTAASDHGDMDTMELNGSMDSLQQRHFAGSFLGLQGILPGPSGLHSADFGEF